MSLRRAGECLTGSFTGSFLLPFFDDISPERCSFLSEVRSLR
jgi:hypothetical protein